MKIIENNKKFNALLNIVEKNNNRKIEKIIDKRLF